MNSEAEMTVIKKSNLCSSLETIPVSHPHCSAFCDFHKMSQDSEMTI